jgi:predicted ABC-type transport system involved in lysophospholipase L1 biosynthesis ATPase subunit
MVEGLPEGRADVHIDGYDLALNEDAIARLRDHIGIVFQVFT